MLPSPGDVKINCVAHPDPGTPEKEKSKPGAASVLVVLEKATVWFEDMEKTMVPGSDTESRRSQYTCWL